MKNKAKESKTKGLKGCILMNIFNPGWDGHLLSKWMSQKELDRRAMTRGEFERKAYGEIVKNIEQDIKHLGLSVTYATKMLIGELALNIIILSRVKFQLAHRPIVEEERVWKLNSVRNGKFSSKAKFYDYDSQYTNEKINPLYGEFLFKLERAINTQLRLLCLLPEQQAKLEKIKIVKRLKQKVLKIQDKNYQYEMDIVCEES